VRGFFRDDDGASLVEYALLIALISLVCVLAIAYLGTTPGPRLSSVGSTLQ
jgi:Flp pilus assembly pilin Flp